METIGIEIREPSKRSKRAYALIYKCEASDCPLRQKNQCTRATMFGDPCPHGKVERVSGWTKRAKKYSKFVKEWKAKAKANTISGPSAKRVTFMGDWVWLPYSHMNHIHGKKKGILFDRYAGLGTTGSPFMRREDFTPEMVIKLVEFRPHAIMGGVISAYVDESVPKFLADLQKAAPELFEQAAELKPEIVTIARKATQRPVRLDFLQIIGWYGHAKIDGKVCFVYSTDTVEFKYIESLAEFPTASDIRVKASLPGDTPVFIDPEDYKYMLIMNKARELDGFAEVDHD